MLQGALRAEGRGFEAAVAEIVRDCGWRLCDVWGDVIGTGPGACDVIMLRIQRVPQVSCFPPDAGSAGEL